MKELFDNFNPENVVAVFTHCDMNPQTDELYERKLKSFEEKGGFKISRYCKFAYSLESLLPLMEMM